MNAKQIKENKNALNRIKRIPTFWFVTTYPFPLPFVIWLNMLPNSKFNLLPVLQFPKQFLREIY